MKQRWCWASQVAEPQVNVWTYCCNCGCDRRLVSGPVRLRVHIRPLAHSGAFRAGAAQRPHALSAVCLGHVLWTGTGASAGPRAQGLCWASPRFSWLAARLGLLAPQLTSQFQSQWCLDHWTGFPGHLPPAVTAGGAARSETGVCSFRRQRVGGEGSILRHL